MPYLVTYTTVRATGRGTLEHMWPEHTMLRETPADWLIRNRQAIKDLTAAGSAPVERDMLILNVLVLTEEQALGFEDIGGGIDAQ